MSLRINKDNIFFILPEDRYSVSNRIDVYMAEDFTLYVKAKVNYNEIPIDKECYMFSRNGMHSGISIYRDVDGNLHAVFNWWIIDKKGENHFKSVTRKLEEDCIDKHNEYIIICNDKEKEMNCYFNNEFVGKISYPKCEKQKYENTFYWFGCGSMMCPEEHRHIGDFNFDSAFLLNKAIDKEGVDDIIKNYKKEYTYELFDGLRKLNFSYPLRKHFAFFCDFNHTTRYKVWDMTFSGNYPQIYIENNIYF